MAGTEGDVIQVTLQGEFEGSQFMNVYFYRCEDTPTAGYLDGLVTEFQADMLEAQADAQTNLVDYQTIRALNLFSGDEVIDDSPTPSTGAVTPTTGPMANFIAAGFKLTRSNARVRNGYKFLNGLQELWVEGNEIQSGYDTVAVGYIAQLSVTLAAGVGVDNFAPVIVGRVPYVTSGGNDAFRLPVSQVEMGDKWAYVVGASLNPLVTTARSRKLGHGI